MRQLTDWYRMEKLKAEKLLSEADTIEKCKEALDFVKEEKVKGLDEEVERVKDKKKKLKKKVKKLEDAVSLEELKKALDKAGGLGVQVRERENTEIRRSGAIIICCARSSGDT